MIITVALLAGFFLLGSYYAIIVKYCSGRRRRRNHPPPSESDSRDGDEEFLDENQGPAVDQPIWFITTVGLQQGIINSITVCKYKKGEGLIEGTECSVCLSEFQEDESLRLLPKCSHAFHIPCIDTWLRSHTNCPLCRARIVSDVINPPPESSTDQNSHSLGQNEQTQIENSGHDTELGNSDIEVNTVGRGGAGELLQILVDERTSKEGVNPKGESALQVNASSDNNHVMGSEKQPLRRSISLDSSSAATVFVGWTNSCADECEGNWIDLDVAYRSKFRKTRNPPIALCLHKSPISMKRSYSCGGRYFLPRHSGGTNNATLCEEASSRYDSQGRAKCLASRQKRLGHYSL